jgi:uncharacterized protein (DUF305 family)
VTQVLSHPVQVALALVAATVGLAAWLVVPASSEADRLGGWEIAAIVALIHHDQQGIVLANQAAAQSPTPSTRSRAGALADSFRRQAVALTGILDASRVPIRRRLVDTTRLEVDDAGAVGCDLMPDDAVSKLAAAAPAEFDARFATLMRRHLVGGSGMARSMLESGILGEDARAAIHTTQDRLS